MIHVIESALSAEAVVKAEAKQSSTIYWLRWIATSRYALLAMTLTLISACQPMQQAYNPQPETQARIVEDSLVTADGTALPLRQFVPKQKPQAVIIALHGFNDYSHAFTGAGEYFMQQNIALYAYDQRGFGGSPQRGIWGGKENYIADLAQLVTLLRTRHKNTPLFLLGESMGGAAVINAVTAPEFPQVDGAILIAPAVWGGDAMNPLYRMLAKLSAYVAPGYTVTGRDLKIQASDNIPMLIAMGKDPFIIKETRMDAIYWLVEFMGDAYAQLPNLPVPVLMLYGGKDEVIPPDIMEHSRTLMPLHAHCNYYPDGYHMLLRDLAGEKVLADIRGWMVGKAARNGLTLCKT